MTKLNTLHGSALPKMPRPRLARKWHDLCNEAPHSVEFHLTFIFSQHSLQDDETISIQKLIGYAREILGAWMNTGH